MKIKHVLVTLTIVPTLFLALNAGAQNIVATGSGNWSSTTPDAPWPGGVVPAATQSVEVDSPNNVTVDTDETTLNVTGTGSVTLAPGVTLNITQDGPTVSGTLVATAVGCTVDFEGNPYSVAGGTYYNLTLSAGYGTLYNYAGPINVLGTLTLAGAASVQVGSFPWTLGNLIIGTNSFFDCSDQSVTVTNSVVINGTLRDLDGQTASLDDLFGSVTLNPTGIWNLGDTVEWGVNGNMTNNGGLIIGSGYGSVTFTGTNCIITGEPFSMPVLAITGTAELQTTANLTYSPTLNGTLVFDLANPGEIVSAGTIYYNSTLEVTNSGPALTTGSTYELFSAPSYNDPYTFATIDLPALAPGLSWANTLTLNGSIAVTGTATGGSGSPTLNVTNIGGTLTLSWDAVTFPGYTLQAQTNSLNGAWYNTSSVSPYTTIVNPSTPSVFYRLILP